MKAKNIFFPALSFIFLLVTSCKNDDPFDPVIDLGDYLYLESSTSALPYIGKSEVIFVDSSGNELAMSVRQLGPMLLGGGIPIISQTDPPEQQPGSMKYESKTIEIYLDNEAENLHFRVWLSALPYFMDAQSGMLADQLAVSYTDPDDTSRRARIMAYLVDRRTFPEGFMEHEEIASQDFHDKTFLNLVKNEDFSKMEEMYYNEENGIVAFTDFTGKLWRFERMD